MWVEPDFIFRSLKCFSFSPLCKGLHMLKLKGYSFQWVMSILISLPFVGVNNVNGLSKYIQAGKDVFYRLKNNPGINWRYILWLFACKFVKLTRDERDSGQVKCLIFDDTVLQKTGKFIEKVSMVWDHVQNSWVLGYKLLVMGYWDGTSMIPLDLSLHREEGKNKDKPYGLRKKDLRRQFNKRRQSGSHSSDRAKETDESKISVMLKMFKRAISHGLKVDYVLVDSWFTCEALINAVAGVKNQCVHLIGMYKIARTQFTFKAKQQTYAQIRNQLGRPKRCRSLKLYYLQADVQYKGHKLQLFYSKIGKNGKWKTILTTDTSISFIRLIEIYQIRWSIEVFFKESKQLLSLGSCQSNNFDAQIADLTITMIQYILLTFRYRFDVYQSKSGMYEKVKDEIEIQKLNERLWGLFIELMQLLTNIIEHDDEMQGLIKLINDGRILERLAQILKTDQHEQNAA